MRVVLVCLMALLFALAVKAGTDWGDFETEMGVLPPDEAVEVRALVAAEIAAERARDEAARQAAHAEAERIAAERAARPLGERLVEARCLSCHDAAQIADARLGTPGWTVTVLRMEWLNGARLEPGERAVIVAHLAAPYPERDRSEWAGLVAGGGLIALLGLGAWVWRRRRWSATHAP